MRTTSLPSPTAIRRRSPWRPAGGLTSALAALALLGACGVVPEASTDEQAATPEVAAEASDAGPDDAGSGAPEPTGSTAASSESTEDPSESEPTPEPEPEPVEPQSFSGTGSEVVILDPLGEDVFYAHVTHDGSSNVALWSVDDNGPAPGRSRPAEPGHREPARRRPRTLTTPLAVGPGMTEPRRKDLPCASPRT